MECDRAPPLEAPYFPGRVTLNGQDDDWARLHKPTMYTLFPNDPATSTDYTAGLQLLHDGQTLKVAVQVPMAYYYSKTNPAACPTVTLLFAIGQAATLRPLGGCAGCQLRACHGHEVEVISINSCMAIPGRLYDAPPAVEHFTALGPACRLNVTTAPSARDRPPSWEPSPPSRRWHVAWSHTSLSEPVGGFVAADAPYTAVHNAPVEGRYFYEFGRALQTYDRRRQEIQMAIDQPVQLAVMVRPPATDQTEAEVEAPEYMPCDWLELKLTPSVAFTSKTFIEVRANTFLAVILPVISIALTLMFCIYLKAYASHVKKELMIQRLTEMTAHGSHDHSDNSLDSPRESL
eukprot:NODE_295_length_1520_cov_374.752549_g214_i0.p1 GENE.NODE_295_length_1520_cov_374.752549_g214_i0~~NODE_295_length_1520_cov_374.752549_g214_i0.p1  ORF type:complete len:387 (+),score=66.94 NODE_295_length_1520_cov_374.752549_g214_i0:122-1162(+)